MRPTDLSFTAPAVKSGEIAEFEFTGEGTTLLAFFPAAFTGTCTNEMEEIQEHLEHFNQHGVDVIGISVDTPFSLKEFSEQNNLEFPLVSDHEKRIIEQYDLSTDFENIGFYGLAKRSVVLIRNEEEVYREVMEDPGQLPDLEAVIKEINNLN